MFYRIKQFIWSINSKITSEDMKFVEKYLNSEQIQLFNKLSTCEQKHCVNVAKDISELHESNNIKYYNELMKAALLHDIGKIECKLNVIDKSVLVILDKLFNGKLKKYKNIKKVDVYYNHAYKGYQILKKIEANKKVLHLVKNHHNNKIINDIELNILKKYDNKN
ncbi:HD domain-containing protein [Haloimpatiens sp. FM7330]|uniref:HD domain-containing protein n=1 Tax=Haloimpatiens sp. FM7330 TaxID=3298610 RepID=UPI0036270910